ncbi:hypothetical protein L484_024628 [Morus notabilis]|uniref:Uncharacterized protein n=1 Tax=Morus notabilis TaxID=981085 RepID=W9R230_9ROSA|nr:hypothetical protein L484_024628 [Morus notabilis]
MPIRDFQNYLEDNLPQNQGLTESQRTLISPVNPESSESFQIKFPWERVFSQQSGLGDNGLLVKINEPNGKELKKAHVITVNDEDKANNSVSKRDVVSPNTFSEIEMLNASRFKEAFTFTIGSSAEGDRRNPKKSTRPRKGGRKEEPAASGIASKRKKIDEADGTKSERYGEFLKICLILWAGKWRRAVDSPTKPNGSDELECSGTGESPCTQESTESNIACPRRWFLLVYQSIPKT